MKINRPRVNQFIGVFLVIILGIVLRLFYLQVIKHDFFIGKLNSQLQRVIKLYPNRGRIFDRHYQPLALTVKNYSVFALPPQIIDKTHFAIAVAPYLETTPHEVLRRLHSQAPFVWLKRQIDPEVKERLANLKLPGLDFIAIEKRVYPNTVLAADVLGFVGIDNQGLSGFEYKYDVFLKGAPGKLMLEGDPHGSRLMTGKHEKSLQNEGGDIVTTLDDYIQYSAQKHLKAGICESLALSGQVIVMDPHTGDILAMADYPDFDPNSWYKYATGVQKNSCITDIFEPGSIFKIVTLAAALETKSFTPESRLRVPESIKVKNRLIREAHARPAGASDVKSVAEIIEESLNVGTTLMAQSIGKDKLFQYINTFGFGQTTKIELPGESQGLLKPLARWSELDLAMTSFGQSIGVTALQMITAVAAVANNGELLKPRIILNLSQGDDQSFKGIAQESRGQIIQPATAQQITKILVETVETGTGTPAKIAGYSIAGKTGTAQIARSDGLGYEAGRYLASFVGYFPASNPQIVMLVTINSPRTNIYGAMIAAPIFKNIALDLIDHLNIPPDQPQP